MAILRRPTNNLTPTHSHVGNLNGHPLTPELVLIKAKSLGIKVIPLDIKSIVESYGLILVKEPMDNEISGYLERRGMAWIVGINSLHHPRRQRFSIAHELAHFLLHSMKQNEFVDRTFLRYQDEANNRMEKEADQFAGELLIPETEFRKLVKSGITSITELSNHFDASSMAIRYRARQLGFLKSGI